MIFESHVYSSLIHYLAKKMFWLLTPYLNCVLL